MLKRSLFISTFFLLFIGLSDYGYGCHRNDGEGNPIRHGTKPCNGGGPTGGQDTRDGDVGEYSFTFTGAVEGQSNGFWIGGGNEKTLNSHGDRATFYHLDFFDTDSPFILGALCFRGLTPDLEFVGTIKQGRGKRAELDWFFQAFTENGDPDSVQYIFQMFGQFLDPWPVPSGEASLVSMDSWEMGVSNEGEDVRNISCVGGADDDGFLVDILVTREN